MLLIWSSSSPLAFLTSTLLPHHLRQHQRPHHTPPRTLRRRPRPSLPFPIRTSIPPKRMIRGLRRRMLNLNLRLSLSLSVFYGGDLFCFRGTMMVVVFYTRQSPQKLPSCASLCGDFARLGWWLLKGGGPWNGCVGAV